MKCINNYIGLEFDKNEKHYRNWHPKFGADGYEHDPTVRDKRKVNPETAIVVAENPKFSYQIGQTLFLHFLAYESGKCQEDNITFVDAKMVFFAFDDDNIYLEDDNYLGEQVVLEMPKTATGIYLTSSDVVKEEKHVKITHVPKNATDIKVGDIVVTIDGAQFTLKFKGKEYVKIHSQYMVGTLKQAVA